MDIHIENLKSFWVFDKDSNSVQISSFQFFLNNEPFFALG